MADIQKLKELLEPVLKEDGITLYDVEWLSNEKTLQVSIMHEDGTMDLDTCAQESEKIGELLDSTNLFTNEYTLEVCSPGAEREIKDLNELDTIQNAYVFVQLHEPVKNMNEFTGEILEVKDGVITLAYRDKAVTRKVEFAKENIAFIRYAVKF